VMGKYTVEKTEQHSDDLRLVRGPDGGVVALLCRPDDAAIIAEAFNVAHETGLTPRQLAEQREKLLAIVKELRSELFLKIADKHDPKTAHNWPEIQRADAAIADAEGVTP